MSEEEVILEETEENESEVIDVNIDDVADAAIDILQTILKAFEIGEITIDEYDGDDGELIFNIEGDDLAVLIGRHGRTLDAIQFLVSSIVRRKVGYRYPVVIDVEGYKDRQRDRLESIANNAARKATSQKKNIHLQPMSPYERRIIHMKLKDRSDVTTESEGVGTNRHVVVIPE